MRSGIRFAGVFGVVAGVYLVGLVVYRMHWLAQSFVSSLTFSIWSAGITFAIVVTMSIPFYLFFFEERRTDADETNECVQDPGTASTKTVLKRVNEQEVQLWILFVLLLTVLPLLIMYHTHARSYGQKQQALREERESSVARETSVADNRTASSAADAYDLSMRPMYGGHAKDERLRTADDVFVANMVEKAGGIQEAYEATVRTAWHAYTNDDLNTAMRRFNQAWLISSSSPDAYRGMAFVEVRREHFDAAESLLEETRAHGGDAVMVDCDLGDLYRINAAAHGSSSDLIEKSYIAYRHAYMAGNVSDSCAAMRLQMKAAVEQVEVSGAHGVASSTVQE